MRLTRIRLMIATILAACLLSAAIADDKPTTQPAEKTVPLKPALPQARFIGTPKDIRSGNLPPKGTEAPKPVQVPEDVVNVARGKDVTASDDEPIIGELELITDGDKEAVDGSFVELAPGKQYVQIDLGKPMEIHAIVIWHDHRSARVYHDVVVQIATDAYFVKKATVFNNDHDNSSGLGQGKDYEYIETNQGHQIPVAAVKGRYVRLYSSGSTAGDENVYTEVEVYARDTK